MIKLHISFATQENGFDLTVLFFKVGELPCTFVVYLSKDIWAPALRSRWTKIVKLSGEAMGKLFIGFLFDSGYFFGHKYFYAIL